MIAVVVVLILVSCAAPVVLAPVSVREGSVFDTTPPGSGLPSGAECADRVVRDGWEPRPENAAANYSVPQDLSLPDWPDYYEPQVNTLFVPRIDGDYTGTTDEILRWGTCKWGFDTDIVRAMAVAESSWRQSQVGDFVDDPQHCVGGAAVPCPTSFGLLQIKHIFRPGSYPYSQLHTAFNVDYTLGVLRACFEGWVTYLEGDYGPGDMWGCVGWHFSGDWKDPDALTYIARVKAHLTGKPWLSW